MRTLKIGFNENDPKLHQSEFPAPPFNYVDGLRKSFPHIWGLGLSDLAEDSFDVWTQYNNGIRSEAIDRWLVQREKWATLHAKDANVLLSEEPSPRNCRALVNMLKWGVVPEIGFSKSVQIIKALVSNEGGEDKITFEKMYNDYPQTAVENAK